MCSFGTAETDADFTVVFLDLRDGRFVVHFRGVLLYLLWH